MVPILVAVSDVAAEGEVVEAVEEKYKLILPGGIIEEVSLIAGDVVAEDGVVGRELCHQKIQHNKEPL